MPVRKSRIPLHDYLDTFLKPTVLMLRNDHAPVLISRGSRHSFKDFSILSKRQILFAVLAGAGLHEVS